MMQPWEQPMTGKLAESVKVMHSALPVLDTQRLRLRAARIEDFSTYAQIYRSPRWPHDEAFDDEDVWLDFCQLVAGWLLRGIGLMTITTKADGKLLGFVLLNHEYGDPEMELGWMLTEAAEGQGIAAEAATALRQYGSDVGLEAVVSYIGTQNSRSAALAQRLGATRDANAEAAYGRTGLHVYRHPQIGARA